MGSLAIHNMKMGAGSLPEENIYGHTKKLRFILAHIGDVLSRLDEPLSLLDYGCGNGSAVSQFLIREGIRYCGVDTHQESLAYARMHFSGKNALFLDHVPEDMLFDVIVYADVIEHLENPTDIILQHRKQLKDYGTIVASVPNGYGPFEIEKKMAEWLRLPVIVMFAAKVKRRLLRRPPPNEEKIPYQDESGHVQFFTKRKLLSMLRESGFHVQTFRNGSFVGAPLSSYFLRGEWLANLNAKTANFLPHWAVSTWYFSAVKIISK